MSPARPLLFLFCILMTGAYAQNGSSTTSPATVTFTLDFPQSSPAHYSITADSSGKGTYTSEATKADLSPDQPANAEPFRYNFTLSPATREKIFELAARAKYFSGNVDYTKHNIANTGAKSLAYKDAKRNTEAKYNYTTNAAIQELTTLFQSISSTLEFGQRLDYAYRYQKLALDDQLKSVEESAKQNGLAELQAIAPLLKQIAADHSVMNVTRARAERLLARAGVANSGTN